MLTEPKMQEFLSTMLKAYHAAHRPKIGNANGKVIRGRAHCVAGVFEDAFANLVCTEILWKKETNCLAFTDFPITVEPPLDCSKKKCETRYIDLMLCKLKEGSDCEILYMAELKTNTGWIRGTVSDRVEDNSNLLRHLKKKSTLISVRGDTLKEVCLPSKYSRYKFSLSPRCRYDLIILSGANAGHSLKHYKKFQRAALASLMILTDDCISWRNTKGEVPSPRVDDYSLLDERIRKCVGHK